MQIPSKSCVFFIVFPSFVKPVVCKTTGLTNEGPTLLMWSYSPPLVCCKRGDFNPKIFALLGIARITTVFVYPRQSWGLQVVLVSTYPYLLSQSLIA